MAFSATASFLKLIVNECPREPPIAVPVLHTKPPLFVKHSIPNSFIQFCAQLE